MNISCNQPLTTDDMARLNSSALAREAEDTMSTQSNGIIPRECDYSIGEALHAIVAGRGLTRA
jgi:hypothetical protein